MQTLLTTLNAKYIHINLAIRLLYELNKHRGDIAFKEFTIKEDFDAIADYCKDFKIVAFSCYIWNITQTLEVCKRIKALNPEVKILLGGPEVSYDWEDVIIRPEVDYIITGEGEIPFAAFLDAFPDVQNVPNVISKGNEEIFYQEKNETFNLENYRYVMPYINDDPAELKNKVLYLETSRGCPYKCEFCLASLDNKVRYIPNESIKAILLYMMQHGRVVKFLDRTFNIKKDFTLDIFQFILDNYRPDNVFQFEITADILHPDIIKFINEKVPKGLFRFEIGIQTVNQKANLEVSRKQNFEKTKGIIKALEHKVEMHLDLIVGMALDYWDDIKYSFEEVFKLFAPELQLGFLKFLKGTPVRHKHQQHGFKFDPNPPYQIIESNYLSKEELHKITVLEHALEIYWNKPRAVNTLKYVTEKYSVFDFLLGVGLVFGSKHDFHRFALTDIYERLAEYADTNHPDDLILKQLIAIDYYLHHKIRPKIMFWEEIEIPHKNELINQRGLNHHKFRFVMLPIDFDYAVFVETNRIESKKNVWIVQYSGTEMPMVL